MSNFRSDLKDMPFVKCPANSVSLLYDQYVHDLSRILDRHAPLVSSLKTKQRADWLSESYRLAKSLRRQFEHAWRKDKCQYNRSCLWRQIAWCNHLANRDKTVYYRKLISDNSHDSKKLWWELHKVLHRSHSTTLPTCEDVPIPKICSFWFPLTVLPSINQRSILTIVSHMMPLCYGMIFHMIYAALQISPVSKVDSKPTYFRNHSHHSFLLPNTGPPPWQRLGTCLMSHDLCLTDWMVCLRIR